MMAVQSLCGRRRRCFLLTSLLLASATFLSLELRRRSFTAFAPSSSFSSLDISDSWLFLTHFIALVVRVSLLQVCFELLVSCAQIVEVWESL